ncbi:16S rRNA (uracil(1498)-N(3))-methyltransferase [Nocardioides salsibiostraticola]
MTLPMHLVDSLDGVRPGSTVAVEGDEAHHAVVVRRLRVGESVLLSDGLGTAVTGEVTSTGKRRFEVSARDVTTIERPTPEIVVVQAIPKGDRGEMAVEMLTEIGVSRIVPWAADRSVAVWKGERAQKSLAKWRSTAREAAKQSRRVWHPEVDAMATTAQIVALLEQVDLAVVLHEDATHPLADLRVPHDGTLAIVVGPEGGLTPNEVNAFVAAGACDLRLGSEVLRTSTAGVVAAGVLLSQTPRWS